MKVASLKVCAVAEHNHNDDVSYFLFSVVDKAHVESRIMLEYLAYKKYKSHKQQKEKLSSKASDDPVHEPDVTEHIESSNQGPSVKADTKGKSAVIALDVIDESDEVFLEKSLSESSAMEAPISLRKRIANLSEQWPGFKRTKRASTLHTATTSSIVGKSNTAESDEEDSSTDNPLADEETQRTQLQRLLGAFDMNLSGGSRSPDSSASRTIQQRMNDTLRVSTISDKTHELMKEFVQILKDVQNGVPLAGQDLLQFFEKHSTDLKTANESVPSFIKTLVLKLLPFSAIPSIEELSKPGALLGLIKSVLNVLKTRFPAFVGGSVLTVMAVVVVMLGLWYAFKRGREEREAQDDPEFSKVTPQEFGRGRQVEISVDGVRYVTVLDEDGMRVPVPEDDRGVYWDKDAPRKDD